MLFREQLKTYRTQNGITQEELAGRLFVSRTLISKWENGVVYPSADHMDRLAELMGISVEELMSGEETRRLVLDQNAAPRFTTAEIIAYVLSLILVISGLTLLIVALVFPQDFTRPADATQSINSITAICLGMMIYGTLMITAGLLSTGAITLARHIKRRKM